MSTYTPMPPSPTAAAGAGRQQSWWRRWWWLVVLFGALVIVVSVCAVGAIPILLTLPPSCAKAANPTRSGAVSQYCPSGHEPYYDSSLAVGSDGTIWFTTESNDKIARMTPQNEAVTVFAAPTAYGVADNGFVRGSDGNIWYIASDMLGRITMKGQVNEFALPKELGEARGITAGLHGPLWVTMWHMGAMPPTLGLLKITLPSDTTQAPQIMQMSAPAITQSRYLTVELDRGGKPLMAAGNDGSLWIVTDATTLTRITPAGSSTQFLLHIPGPAPSCGSDCERVVGLTAGPDDAMWFIDEWNHVGRITPGGVTTFFSMPVGWQFAYVSVSMSAGPDGNIWFYPAGSDSSNIGRITPDGAVTAFSLPRCSAENITAGSDGGVWFLCRHYSLDTSSTRISRITP